MRLRVRLGKLGMARFYSHLDLQRTLERALRRAALPLAYSQGFNPRPRVSFASALATGTSSEGEFIDVELTEAMEPERFLALVNACCPAGLQLMEAQVIEGKGESLMALLNAAAYRLKLAAPASLAPDSLSTAVGELLEADEVKVTKLSRGRSRLVNIRPQVYALELRGPLELWALLQTGSEGNLKPDDMIAGLCAMQPEGLAGLELAEVHRLMLYRRDPESAELTEPWAL